MKTKQGTSIDAMLAYARILMLMESRQNAFHIVVIDMLAKDDDHFERMVNKYHTLSFENLDSLTEIITETCAKEL
jgi:hypothetical protein